MKQQRLVSSKLLDRKWRERDQLIHKRKLREVQSAIRTQQSKPFQPQMNMRNAKKDAMLESKYQIGTNYNLFIIGRYTEIERENRILLEKMSNIMQTHKPSLYNPSKFSIYNNNQSQIVLRRPRLIVNTERRNS